MKTINRLALAAFLIAILPGLIVAARDARHAAQVAANKAAAVIAIGLPY